MPRDRQPLKPDPKIAISFEKDGLVLRYFSMVSTVGTPTTVAAQELRVECLFPADAETERLHLSLSVRISQGLIREPIQVFATAALALTASASSLER